MIHPIIEVVERVRARQKSYVVRPVAAADTAELVRLGQTIFGSFFSEPEWNWKYGANPGGIGVGYVACDLRTNEIVGHLAALPMVAKCPWGTEKLYCLVDSMVTRNFRRRGVPLDLLITVDTALRKNNGRAYGLPNELALKYLHTAGAKTVSLVPVFVKVLWWRELFRAVAKNRFGTHLLKRRTQPPPLRRSPRAFNIEKVESFSGAVDSLWERASQRAPIMVQRNVSFLNWRYATHPKRPYHLFTASTGDRCDAYAVVRIVEKAGMKVAVIADWLAAGDQTKCGKAVLRYATQWAKDQGCAVICGAFAVPQALRNVFYWLGFFSTRLTKARRAFNLVISYTQLMEHEEGHAADTGRHAAFWLNEKNWYFSFGDTDVI